MAAQIVCSVHTNIAHINGILDTAISDICINAYQQQCASLMSWSEGRMINQEELI